MSRLGDLLDAPVQQGRLGALLDAEPQFQDWYAGHAQNLGLNPDPDDPLHFYDYRAAFRAGAAPDETGHWPSQFKREGHPRLILDGVDTRTGQPTTPTLTQPQIDRFTRMKATVDDPLRQTQEKESQDSMLIAGEPPGVFSRIKDVISEHTPFFQPDISYRTGDKRYFEKSRAELLARAGLDIGRGGVRVLADRMSGLSLNTLDMAANWYDKTILDSDEPVKTLGEFADKITGLEDAEGRTGEAIRRSAELTGGFAKFLGRLKTVGRFLPQTQGFAGDVARTGLQFGTAETFNQIAKKITDDPTFEGGVAVERSFVIGALFETAFKGVKFGYNLLRPTEQTAALKALGLKKGATEAEIRKAAQGLAKKFHPDKVAGQVDKFKSVIRARDTALAQVRGEDVVQAVKRRGLRLPGTVAPQAKPVAPAVAPVAKVPPVQPKVPPKAPEAKRKGLIDQAVEDWAAGRLYIDNNGNYHLKTQTEFRGGKKVYVGKGPIAPYNKQIKPHVSPETLQRMAAREVVKETEPQKEAEVVKAEDSWKYTDKEWHQLMQEELPEAVKRTPYTPATGWVRGAQRVRIKDALGRGEKVRKVVLLDFKGEKWADEALAKKPTIKKIGKVKPKAPMKPGFVDLTPIAEAGEQIRTTTGKVTKIVTRFTGVESKVRQTMINYEEQVKEIPKIAAKESIEKFGHLTPEQEIAIRRHQEQPKKYDLPTNLKKEHAALVKGQEWAGSVLEELGYPANWPNTYIQRLQAKLKKVQSREEPDPVQEKMLEDSIAEAKDLRYLHHYYKKRPLIKRIGRGVSKTITKKPRGLLGRKIPTLEKAKELGLEPAPLAVSYAHMIASAKRAQAANELIKAINKNPNLSQWEELAPEDWVRLDEKIFPAAVQHRAWAEEGKVKQAKRFRRYPAPIADALEEIAYSRGNHPIEKAYDQLNFALKIIGFYNPLVMTKNDLVQGWRAAGLKHAFYLIKATNTFAKKGPEYQMLRENGLFNNIVNYTPTATEVAENMLDIVRKGKPAHYAKAAAKWLNPLRITNTLREFNEVTTWNLDEIARIATYHAIKDTKMTKGLTEFEVVELANDFMVNYGKLPKESKRWLGKAFFVPTYRIGNFRVFWGTMMKQPWRHKGPILRTVAYKLFIYFGLGSVVAAAIEWATKRKVAAWTELGYRLVIHNPGTNKDTVYALSDPLLEGAKLSQRPILHSAALNLAPLPSLLVRLSTGPRFKASKDPYGEFFKLGTPIYRDIVNWKDPDKTVPQKILTQLAIAYVYTRRARKEDKDTAAVALAKATSIWTDWKMQKEQLRKMVHGPKKKTERQKRIDAIRRKRRPSVRR